MARLAAAGLVEFVTKDPTPVLRATERDVILAAGNVAVEGFARPIP